MAAWAEAFGVYETTEPGKVTVMLHEGLVNVLSGAQAALREVNVPRPGPLATVNAQQAGDVFAGFEAQFAADELDEIITVQQRAQTELGARLIGAVGRDGRIVAALSCEQLLVASAWANGLHVRLRSVTGDPEVAVGEGQSLLAESEFDELLGGPGDDGPVELDQVDILAMILATFATELLRVHAKVQTAHS